MESLDMKINNSQLARDLNVDRRTVEKYLNGYQQCFASNMFRTLQLKV